jgi:hypothetical protein
VLEHFGTDRVTLVVIGVEQLLVRAAGDHGSQLPAQVVGVRDADAHADATGREMDVGGAARKTFP